MSSNYLRDYLSETDEERRERREQEEIEREVRNEDARAEYEIERYHVRGICAPDY